RAAQPRAALPSAAVSSAVVPGSAVSSAAVLGSAVRFELLEDRAGGRLAAALQEAVDQPRCGLGVVDGDGEPGAGAQVEPDGGARAHDHRRAAAELQAAA